MRFLVSTGFVPDGDPAALMALLPQEQAHIAELTAQGKVEALYVQADRSHVWIVMVGAAEADVADTLATFPLFPYMRPTYTPLQG